MKSKKGFTLIELLAVIVILSIIMVVAIPQILNVIDDSRKSSAMSSALGYISAVEYNNKLATMYTDKYTKITGDDLDVTSSTFDNVKISGNKPTDGIMSIHNNGKVTSATNLCFYGYAVSYNGKNVSIAGKCSEMSGNTYTITFDSSGGSEVQPITKVEGAPITLPTPTKEGYAFDGWYTAIEDGEKVTITTMGDENITLYAKWIVAVASVNDVNYPSVIAAIDSIESSGTVVLLSDRTENVTVPNGKTITLNLNNKTLNGKLTNNATLTLLNGNLNNDSANAIVNNGTLTIENGTYTNAASNAGVISNNGTLTINNGTFTAQNSTVVTTRENHVSTIYNGTFRSYKSNGQVLYNNGELNVRGGNYSGSRKIVHNVATGTVNISGGTLETVSSGSNVIANLGTTNISGTAVLNGNSSEFSTISTQNNTTLNIEGGTITSNHNAILTYSGNNTKISGGSIIANGSHNAISLKAGSVVEIIDGLIESNANGCIINEENSTIYIKGGQLKVKNSSTANNVINNFGRTEISGGIIRSESSSTAAVHNKNTGTMIISNGTITSTQSGSIALYSVGNLTISGGIFNSSYYAVYAAGGTRSITGGTFNGPTFY